MSEAVRNEADFDFILEAILYTIYIDIFLVIAPFLFVGARTAWYWGVSYLAALVFIILLNPINRVILTVELIAHSLLFAVFIWFFQSRYIEQIDSYFA